MEKFVHLHNHTEFSLLDGATKIAELVAETKNRGWDAVAITDHGNMYGALQFYTACLGAGIKPIIGCEFYTCDDISKRLGKHEANHLILIAKNNEGYQNLLKLNSIAFVEGFYYKPRIDMNILKEHKEGLICLSACLAGSIPQLIMQNRYEDAKKMSLEFNEMFPGGDFYLEIQNHGLPEDNDVMVALKKISIETGIKLVATNDVHYLRKEDSNIQDVLMCVQMGKTLDDTDRLKFSTDEFYYKTYDEMKEIFAGYEESLTTTLEIADKCDVIIKRSLHGEMGLDSKYVLPASENFIPPYTAPDGMDNFEYLKKLCYDGLARKYAEITPEIKERADRELGIIKDQGFVEYFLVVWDYCNFARSHGIPVGPGRGSGAGSVVAYSTGITNIDPIKYDLLFERFIHKERVTMPDFDVDFDVEGRERVVDYVRERYGKESVAQIITFGCMQAKNAIKDVARVLKISLSDADKLTKNIPGKLPDGIKKPPVLKYYFGQTGKEENEKFIIPDLKKAYDEDPDIKRLVDIAIKLEGAPRNTSKHAAGVLIAPGRVDHFVPLAKNGEDVTTQYDMIELETLGLLKMDFLGLRTLTDIYKAIDYVKEDKGITVDFEKMDYDDKKVFELISSGNTEAIFQLESGGMKKFMKDLKPSNLEDIIAGISLYRPGPMDSIPRYIKNKQNPEQIVYADKCLEPITNMTYGCIVYQEQVMKILQVMGGYSLGQADMVRRIMSKKKKDKMALEREKFINGWKDPKEGKDIKGAINLGIKKEVAEQVFSEMESFASYAFNKSHAAAYAYLAYQTGYLRCYYEVEYLTSVINNRINNSDEIKKYLTYAKKEKIAVLPANINMSKTYFSVENGGIRYGLSGLKGVGIGVIESIIEERNENGEFKDFYSFLTRMADRDTNAINKKCLEGLIFSGAFDIFGHNRSQLIAVFESAVDKVTKDKKNQASGQFSMFQEFASVTEKIDTITMPVMKEYNKFSKLKYEKEVMGIYMSGHPLDDYIDKFDEYNFSADIANELNSNNDSEEDFEEEEKINLTGIEDGGNVSCGGILVEVKKVITKNGNKEMAILTIEDLYGTIEIMLFPKIFARYKEMLEEDKMYTVKGKISIRSGDSPIVLADSIMPWENEEVQEVVADKKICIKFDTQDRKIYDKIMLILSMYSGTCPVIIRCKNSGQAFKANKLANANNHLFNELIGVLGEENVAIVDNKV